MMPKVVPRSLPIQVATVLYCLIFEAIRVGYAGPVTCIAVRSQGVIGEKLTPELIQRILKETHATNIRIISPGTATTQEVRSDRVNVQLDPDGIVLDIRCG
jgi:hypothetical protein